MVDWFLADWNDLYVLSYGFVFWFLILCIKDKIKDLKKIIRQYYLLAITLQYLDSISKVSKEKPFDITVLENKLYLVFLSFQKAKSAGNSKI